MPAMYLACITGPIFLLWTSDFNPSSQFDMPFQSASFVVIGKFQCRWTISGAYTEYSAMFCACDASCQGVSGGNPYWGRQLSRTYPTNHPCPCTWPTARRHGGRFRVVAATWYIALAQLNRGPLVLGANRCCLPS